jgi:hypothetical protein
MDSSSTDIFEIYVDDTRYAVPTLHLIVATTVANARAAAERILAESAHHVGAELRLAGERLEGLGSFSTRRHPAPEAEDRV